MTTTTEWSLEFDQFYNNISSDQAPGLEEHEKSVFLTRAQNDIVVAAFSSVAKASMSGFDMSEIRQSDFFPLITTVKDIPFNFSKSDYLAAGFPEGVANGKAIYMKLPDDILVLINEEVLLDSGALQVVPLSYTEYHRLSSRPYKYPPKGQVWRLDIGSGDTVATGSGEDSVRERLVQLVSPKLDQTAKDQYYYLRYIRKPKPIILPDEIDGDTAELSIDGYEYPLDPVCELPEHLHNMIVQRAVLLAKIAWNDSVSLQQSANQ